jgi:hypothetical protein
LFGGEEARQFWRSKANECYRSEVQEVANLGEAVAVLLVLILFATNHPMQNPHPAIVASEAQCPVRKFTPQQPKQPFKQSNLKPLRTEKFRQALPKT